jgi:hypothetical protein
METTIAFPLIVHVNIVVNEVVVEKVYDRMLAINYFDTYSIKKVPLLQTDKHAS